MNPRHFIKVIIIVHTRDKGPKKGSDSGNENSGTGSRKFQRQGWLGLKTVISERQEKGREI